MELVGLSPYSIGTQNRKLNILPYLMLFPIFPCSSCSPLDSRPLTPKSDSELVSKPLERSVQNNNPQMHWDWGELPQATKVREKKQE